MWNLSFRSSRGLLVLPKYWIKDYHSTTCLYFAWTLYEDKLLVQEIQKYSTDSIPWKDIAKNFQGKKTDISCRNRWKKLQNNNNQEGKNILKLKESIPSPSPSPSSSPSSSSSPAISKQKSGPWTKDEDQLLIDIMKNDPNISFVRVSEAMSYTRTPIQCHYRWKTIGSEIRKSITSNIITDSLKKTNIPIYSQSKLTRWSEEEVRGLVSSPSHSLSLPLSLFLILSYSIRFINY